MRKCQAETSKEEHISENNLEETRETVRSRDLGERKRKSEWKNTAEIKGMT